MADLLFKCSGCATHLVVDADCVGEKVECTSCGQLVLVPAPGILFTCMQCKTELVTPAGLAGESFNCPNCETGLTVPPFSGKPLLLKQKPRLVVPSPAPSSPERRCPHCDGDIAPAAIICVNCGRNLTTGKKVGQHISPVSSAIGNLLGAIGIPLLFVGLAVGGWYYWHYQKEQAEQQQKAATVEKAQQLKAETEAKAKAEVDQKQAEAEAKVAAERKKTEAAKAEAERQRVAQEKVDRAQRELRLARLRDHFDNITDVSLLDALAYLSTDRNLRMSIDPDIIDSVRTVRINLDNLSALNDQTSMDALFNKHGFVIHPCPAMKSDTNLVVLVTTEPIWAYSCACQQLRNKKLPQALQILDKAQSDTTEFGKHCIALQGVLSKLIALQSELGQLSQKVRQSIADCESNYKDAQMFWRGATANSSGFTSGFGSSVYGGRRIGDSSAELQKATAQSRYDKALDDLRITCADMAMFDRKATAMNQALCDRFSDAFRARLYIESKFLLDSYLETFTTLKNLYGEIEKSGILTDVGLENYYHAENAFRNCAATAQAFRNDLGDMPDDIRKIQQTVGDLLRLSLDATSSIHIDAASNDTVQRGLRISNAAFFDDHGNIMLRAAAGYFHVQLHAQAIGGGIATIPSHIETLSREFDGEQKPGLFLAVLEATGQDVASLSRTEATNKIGSATGLCVSMAEGTPFPLSVWFSPREHLKVTHETSTSASAGIVTRAAIYWNAWNVSERDTYEIKAEPIVFEDYGKKDEYMCIAAKETYKWLCNTYPTNMNDKAIHIAFQSCYADKHGDSAGVTMATAAYSAIMGKSIRRSVAMTGSFRSDGSVHAVGGIFEKIRGAATAPGIEIIVLPKENEGDVMLLPYDTLCRVAIISTDDITTYIKYATDPSFNLQALAKLRKAQILLLTGKRDQAVPLLLEVAADCPEIYTAGRLLDLIAFLTKVRHADIAQTNPI